MINERSGNATLPVITPLSAIFYAICIFLVSVIQSCLYSSFDFFGTIPSLGLAFCCAAGYFDGERVGGVTGLCLGFLIDALGSAAFSFLPLAYALIGYFCGALSASCRGKLSLGHCFLSYCIRLGVSVGVGATVTLFCIFFNAQNPDVISSVFFVALPESVISFIFGLPFWVVYRVIYRKRSNFSE